MGAEDHAPVLPVPRFHDFSRINNMKLLRDIAFSIDFLNGKRNDIEVEDGGGQKEHHESVMPLNLLRGKFFQITRIIVVSLTHKRMTGCS
jgi:hypothetical protein